MNALDVNFVQQIKLSKHIGQDFLLDKTWILECQGDAGGIHSWYSRVTKFRST